MSSQPSPSSGFLDLCVRQAKNEKICICGSGGCGRILKSDQYGPNYAGRRMERPIGVISLSVLSKLNLGESGVLVGLDLPESVQNHLMHMGFVPDALVTVLRRAPAGDPTVYGVDGMEIALRRETAAAIQMRAADAETQETVEEEQKIAADQDRPELIEAAR